MKKRFDKIDRLRIASPCPMGWEQMAGDDRVRHCELCSLKVYNIAEMSRSDAETLITNSEGRICARLFRRADGAVITKDCPVGLRAIRRRVARVAGAAFATIFSLCGSVMGQKPNAKDQACQQQVKITKKVVDASTGEAVIGGVVEDQVGAVVTGAKISIRNPKTGKSYEVESNAEGRFASPGLAAGAYELSIKAFGFQDLVVKDLTIGARDNVSVEVLLLNVMTTVIVGMLVDDDSRNTEGNSMRVAMSGEKIRKLPIP